MFTISSSRSQKRKPFNTAVLHIVDGKREADVLNENKTKLLILWGKKKNADRRTLTQELTIRIWTGAPVQDVLKLQDEPRSVEQLCSILEADPV